MDTFDKSIAVAVKSRSPTSQLHIAVLNIFHILSQVLIVRASIFTECTMNPMFVWQVSYHAECICLFHRTFIIKIQYNMIWFHLIDSSIVKNKKQITKPKHLMITNNISFIISASIIQFVIIVNISLWSTVALSV